MNIRKNEIYGIAGESGCGKTSLMKTLYAFIKPPLRLMDGQVLYYRDGEEFDIYSLSKEERRKLRWEYIAYIPQGAMSIFNPVIKIEDTYRDFLNSHLSGKTKDEIFEIAREHIKQLGLPMKVLNSYPHQLSGGMRQKSCHSPGSLIKTSSYFC